MGFDDVALSSMMPLVRLMLKNEKRRAELERLLSSSLSFTAPERFLARILLVTLIITGIVVSLSLVLIIPNYEFFIVSFRNGMAFNSAFLPFTIKVLIGFSILVVPPLIFLMLYNMPKISSSDLAFKIDTELPFFSAYLSMMVSSGLSVFRAVERVASISILDTTARVSRIAYMRFKAFGEDPISALNDVALSSPSKSFMEFMTGYVTNVRTGGDVLHFVNTKLHDIVSATVERARRGAEMLGTLMESYIGSAVILLIGLDVMYLAQTVTPNGNALAAVNQAINSNFMFGLLITPMITLAFMYLGEVSGFKTPFTDYRPYKVGGIAAAIAGVASLFFFVEWFHGNLANRVLLFGYPFDFTEVVGITLIIAFTPAAIYGSRIVSQRWELEKELSLFLRDFTELSKSGFVPEKIFETLSETRHYGELDPYLAEITKQVRYGEPLRNVVNSVMGRMHSYLAKVFNWLLLESIEFGGARPEVLESLASFSSDIVTIQEDARARMKPLRFVPYIGAGILILTLAIMLSSIVSLAAVLNHFPPSTIDLLSTSFSISVIINSFLMGFVAGKLGEGELAMGFKHAIALTALTLVVYMASPLIGHMLFGGLMANSSGGFP
jgi:flagellar protein FlaJ